MSFSSFRSATLQCPVGRRPVNWVRFLRPTPFFSECKHPNLYSSTHHIGTDNNTCTHLCHSVMQANLPETENYTQLPTALRTPARTYACLYTIKFLALRICISQRTDENTSKYFHHKSFVRGYSVFFFLLSTNSWKRYYYPISKIIFNVFSLWGVIFSAPVQTGLGVHEGYRVFHGGKAAETCRWPHTPT
jgi:hypothetical protein